MVPIPGPAELKTFWQNENFLGINDAVMFTLHKLIMFIKTNET